MHEIHFTKDSATGCTWTNSKPYVMTECVSENDRMYAYLNAALSIDEDVTLMDFLSIISKNPENSKFIFTIMGIDGKAILEEMSREPSPEIAPFKKIYLKRNIEIFSGGLLIDDKSLIIDEGAPPWSISNETLGRLPLAIEPEHGICLLNEKYKSIFSRKYPNKMTLNDAITVIGNELAFAPLNENKWRKTKIADEQIDRLGK